MSSDEREDTTVYKVVVNHEEQYLHLAGRQGKRSRLERCGKTGPKNECFAYIKEVWTDMRPLSLRKKMEDA